MRVWANNAHCWEIFDKNSIEKLNFYFFNFIFYFIFRKFVTKNRAFGNNTIFLQQFFRFRGGAGDSPISPWQRPCAPGTPYKCIFLNFWQTFRKKYDEIFKNLEKLQIFNQNYQKIVNFSIDYYNNLKTSPASGGSSTWSPIRWPQLQALPWWTSIPGNHGRKCIYPIRQNQFFNLCGKLIQFLRFWQEDERGVGGIAGEHDYL